MPNPWDQRLGVWWIADDHPDQPAIIESPSGITLSYAELAGRAHQVVHGLRRAGIVAGDIVAYALPNGADIVWWQLALQEGGFTAISLNPQLSAHEIQTILEHSGAAAVVLGHEYAGATDLGATDSLRLRVSVGGPIDGFTTYEELVAGQPTSLPEDRSFGSPMSYSSGTTGLPKAITRAAVKGDPSQIADAMKLFCQAFQFKPLDGIHLVSAGMSHGGCQSFYLGALNAGQSLVIMGKFDAEAALAAIERNRVTTGYMVPTQFVRFLKLPEDVKSNYDVSSLEVIVHSAAPCPLDVKQQMMDWWGPVIWETYGGMEGAAAIAKPHRWLEKPGTVGRAINGVTLRILDDEGNELPTGTIGNVFLEPKASTFRYKDDPELTASVHRGKAFTLGDVGFLDDDGYLFLRDRAKDMIISGGVNIYPAEVEAVLLGHPAVRDVAVIGVPDADWGESVKAIVEVADGQTADDVLARELIDYCQGRLAKFKWPRSVDFRDALPRTETGKLIKRWLREEYAQAAATYARAAVSARGKHAAVPGDLVNVVSSHRERAVVRVGDVFVKVDTDTDRGARELQALRRMTAVPVPGVLWVEAGPPHVMALAAVAGTPLGVWDKPSDFPDAVWETVGDAIRRIHRSAPLTEAATAQVITAVASHPSHLDAYQRWFHDHEVGDLALVDRLAAAASAFFQDWRPTVGLLHGDLQVDHIFIEDDAVSAVIDWADTGWGDVVADLAILTNGFPEQLPALVRGYGEPISDDAVFAYWVLRRLAVIHWRADHDMAIDADVTALCELERRERRD